MTPHIQYLWNIKTKKSSHSFDTVPQSPLCLIFNSCLHCRKCSGETNLERGPINNLWFWLLKIHPESISLFLQHLVFHPSVLTSAHCFVHPFLCWSMCIIPLGAHEREKRVDEGGEGAREVLQYGWMSRCWKEREEKPRWLLFSRRTQGLMKSKEHLCGPLYPFLLVTKHFTLLTK